jgi:hypothetical protein
MLTAASMDHGIVRFSWILPGMGIPSGWILSFRSFVSICLRKHLNEVEHVYAIMSIVGEGYKSRPARR